MDYSFTARIEEEFDEVAEGKMKWNDMINDFYSPFKKDVDKQLKLRKEPKVKRELGIDPVSGKESSRELEYGPMVQIG